MNPSGWHRNIELRSGKQPRSSHWIHENGNRIWQGWMPDKTFVYQVQLKDTEHTKDFVYLQDAKDFGKSWVGVL